MPSNPNKVNQDSYFTLARFNAFKYIHYFGVCDGHGVNGRDVSSFIKQELGKLLRNEVGNSFDATKEGEFPES